MLHYQVQRVGRNRGAPRIWLQGLVLVRAGFRAGASFVTQVAAMRLELVLDEQGGRTVSAKARGDARLPVVDLNSMKVLAGLADLAAVRIVVAAPGRIVIEAMASDVRRRERLDRAWTRLNQGDSLFVGSVSHGGGVMSHALHRGFAQAEIDSMLRFANEIRPDLVDHAARTNDAWEADTIAPAAPLQEFAFDADMVAQLPAVDVLEAGLPCSGASVSGRAKRGLVAAEAHPEVGHLVAAFLSLVARVNPVVIIIENVVPYLSTGSAWILRNQLADWGYEVQELVFRGSEFNALEERERAVLIGVTCGIQFDLGAVERPARQRLRLGDILDDIPANSSRWSAVAGLKAKQVRDEAEGKGFRMQIFDHDASTIGTVTKGYAKVRSTDPKIRHQDDPELLRQLTPAEHARAKSIPTHLVDGISETLAHEVLGQSVIHGAFVAIGAHVGQALLRWASQTQRALVTSSACS